MDEMKDQAGEWFHKVDQNPHIYTAFYNNAATSKEFAAFKADDSSHLKLLYCIDMLNEGIHVDDVDGVILLRRCHPSFTCSRLAVHCPQGRGRHR